MKKLEKRWVFWWKIACVVALCWIRGVKIVPFCIYRSAEEQNERYKEGLSYCDGYKKISKHQRWLAIDFAIPTDDWSDFIWEPDPQYFIFGEIAEKMGLTWGHRWYEKGRKKFDDVYHIQLD